jgi:hypothetical protein
MLSYESLLNGDLNWALLEGSMHFEGTSAVYRTLRRLVHRLEDLGFNYAIAGGMGLFFHGYRRFTEAPALAYCAFSYAAVAATRRVAGPGDLSNRGYFRLRNCIASSLACERMDE